MSLLLKKASIWTVLSTLAAILTSGTAHAQSPPVTKTTKPKSTAPSETSASELRLDDPPKEMLTPEENNDKQAIRKFQSAMYAGRRSATADQEIRSGLRIMIYRMTLLENQKKVRSRLNEFLNILLRAGTKQRNMQDRKDFRTFVCKEILTLTKGLLDNNYEVRLNATILISKLNVTVPGRSNNPPRAEAYSPAADVLLEILKNKSHPPAVKIIATRGIKRMALYGSPILKTTLKNDLVKSIASELENAKKLSISQGRNWYQSVLLETLAAVNLPLTADGQPLIYNTLLRYLDDGSLDPSVRCVAAKSIGRANLSRVAQVKPDVLAVKLGKLGLDLTAEYNKDIQNYHHWQKCFWNLYIAFRAQDENDTNMYRDRKLGLLAQFQGQKDLNDAYNQITPLTSHLLRQPVRKANGTRALEYLPKKEIQALFDWIKNHPQSAKSMNNRSTPVSAADSR